MKKRFVENKYRLSIMLVLVILIFLYIIDIFSVSEVTNFAITFAALLFSMSSVFDTFSKGSRCEGVVRFVLDTSAICVFMLIPNLNDVQLVYDIMEIFDTNVLLFLSLFFTMANQWASEIKQKDFVNR